MILLLLLLRSFLFRLRRHQTLEKAFIGYQNTSNFVKNTPLRTVFSALFSVFGYPDETLTLVFHILHQTLKKVTSFPNASKFVRNTLVRVVFLTLHAVFGKVFKYCLLCLIYFVTCGWIALQSSLTLFLGYSTGIPVFPPS